MTDPHRAATIAQIALNAAGTSALAAAAQRCEADYVLPSPADLKLPSGALAAMARAAAGDPDAAAFLLSVRGLTPDPAWRGRRCRSHERNLESLRFADIIPAGGLLVRREALVAALADMPSIPDADQWRAACRHIARAGRIAALDVTLRRSRLMDGERPTPGFPALSRPGRVLVLGQIEVSNSLYFDFLDASADIAVDFRALTRLSIDGPALASADLVILVRELHRFWDEGVIAFLDAAHVPFVWFTDDNFLALRAEGDAPAFYTEPRMRVALAKAAGVWTSTEALAAANLWLHPGVGVWKPAFDPNLAEAPPAPGRPLTIALAGGDFRLPGLTGAALDRLREIDEREDLRLLLTPAGAAMLRPALPRAEIVVPAPQRSFRQFIRAWRRFAPDILLHPAGATGNAPFKSPTAAIVAGYLGAVPVVADEAAYQDWGEAEGVLQLGVAGEGLAAAAGGAHRADWRGEMRERLAEAVQARFSADGRVARLMKLVRPTPRRNPVAVAENILESPQFNRQQAARRLAHISRRFRDQIRRPG